MQQHINRITDILRRDDGISGAMHYTEQISWVLFLKFLDDYESSEADAADLDGREYRYMVEEKYRWASWIRRDNGHFSGDYSQRVRQKSTRTQKKRTGYIRATQGSLEDRWSVSYILILYIGISSQWIFTFQEFANFQKTRNPEFRICELSGRRQ